MQFEDLPPEQHPDPAVQEFRDTMAQLYDQWLTQRAERMRQGLTTPKPWQLHFSEKMGGAINKLEVEFWKPSASPERKQYLRQEQTRIARQALERRASKHDGEPVERQPSRPPTLRVFAHS
jgi:hypothetical protein